MGGARASPQVKWEDRVPEKVRKRRDCKDSNEYVETCFAHFLESSYEQTSDIDRLIKVMESGDIYGLCVMLLR